MIAVPAHALQATEITQDVNLTCKGLNEYIITDANIATHSSGENVSIEISSDESMSGVYVIYNSIPSKGSLNDSTVIAENGFLHEFIPLNNVHNAVLSYPQTDICDIKVYSSGQLPPDVQLWRKGEAETDILLCATHSDDDQLFFAGLLPFYASHIGANVRVAYFTNHFDTYNRTHELLDGLWHCGVKNYPDISQFPDAYSESAQDALLQFQNRGHSYDDVLAFQRELLEKYRPLVVVLHDLNGEYGHGQHMLNTESFLQVIEYPIENQYIPEKIYIHLYEQNSILLDLDTPLEEFGGLSAFQISQQAFGFHKSQHWTWFYQWIYGKNSDITKASQIRNYNPGEYGLYFSSVGEDTDKNDILENVTTYSLRRQLAENKRQEENIKNIKATMQNILDFTYPYSFVSVMENNSYIILYAITGLIAISLFMLLIFKKRKGK